MEPPRAAERSALVSRAVRVDPPPFRAAVEAFERPRTVWGAPGEATVVAGGAAARITAAGPDRFEQVQEASDRLFSDGDVHAGTEAACPRLFGGFAFHDGACNGDPWRSFPEAQFVFPRVQVTYTEERGTWLTVNAADPDATPAAVEERLAAERDRLTDLPGPGPVADPPGVVERHRTTDREAWRDSVAAAIDRIDAGDLRKVVLAQALAVDLADDLADDLAVADVLARLDETYPDCHLFLLEPNGAASFLGATPERLVDLRGRTVETGALAGTTGRGETPTEDEWLAEELRSSAKNGHEHELVAEAIREQLRPFAASVSTGERSIRRLATVQHLWTPITAELATDEHVLDLVEALHPTPAVGGLPPDRALATIRETEAFDRGWYAAPVGWFDAAGNGSFGVALRSAVVEDRTATLFAGVGIVADSDPDAEWDEVELKFRPILDELERA